MGTNSNLSGMRAYQIGNQWYLQEWNQGLTMAFMQTQDHNYNTHTIYKVTSSVGWNISKEREGSERSCRKMSLTPKYIGLLTSLSFVSWVNIPMYEYIGEGNFGKSPQTTTNSAKRNLDKLRYPIIVSTRFQK